MATVHIKVEISCAEANILAALIATLIALGKSYVEETGKVTYEDDIEV